MTESLYSEKAVVEKATRNALRMMKDAGFNIPDRIEVVVDPELPFMGYSTKVASGDRIVISGKALTSGTVETLLVHELSHIYRINTNHPSHNHELLNKVEQSVLRKCHLTKDYQIAIVQQAINHVQDLYADDVAFEALRRSQAFPDDQAFSFFLGWMNDRSLGQKDAKTVWMDMGILLNNCFALSNMIRHGVPDVRNQAEIKVQRFLSQTSEQTRRGFTYFKDFMASLKEDTTEKEFEEKLTDYLTKIAELAD